MAIPANTASSISAESRRAARGTSNRSQKIVDVRHHQQVPDNNEHTAENVAEQDHSDPERDRHNAAAQRNDRQRSQQDREDEETVVESGDVDRGRPGDALAQTAMTNWPLTVPRTIAPILARYRSVTSSPSGLSWRMSGRHSFRFTSSEMNTYRKMIDGRHPAEHAAGSALQQVQQPFTDLLRDGGHRSSAASPAVTVTSSEWHPCAIHSLTSRSAWSPSVDRSVARDPARYAVRPSW